jgi:mannose-6-phosphate isomerase-like protein (cupin superfamily)
MHEEDNHLVTQQQAVLSRETDLPRAECGNSASTTRLVNWFCGSQSMINGIMTIPPKGVMSLHCHNCEESVLVLSGTDIAVVGETELAVETADVTRAPANPTQQFRNGSDSENIRIFWTYASAGTTRTMVESGKTHLIEAEHKA